MKMDEVLAFTKKNTSFKKYLAPVAERQLNLTAQIATIFYVSSFHRVVVMIAILLGIPPAKSRPYILPPLTLPAHHTRLVPLY